MRADERNFCILNQGSPKAIVMGLSSEPAQLLNLPKIQTNPIPLIKRFSGGGTVIIDEETLFITFILGKEALPIAPFPEPILRWSASLYQNAWQIPDFHLRENDYCIAERKCGGNAQYIQKNRWLHHTSFLWNYTEKNMEYLLLPPKRPAYRQNRSHEQFLTRLNQHAKTPETLQEAIKNELVKHFYMEPISKDSLELKPHRQSTQKVEIALLSKLIEM